MINKQYLFNFRGGQTGTFLGANLAPLENILSKGTDVAGMHSLFRIKLYKFAKMFFLSCHQTIGSACRSKIGSAMYLSTSTIAEAVGSWTVLSMLTDASNSCQINCRRRRRLCSPTC